MIGIKVKIFICSLSAFCILNVGNTSDNLVARKFVVSPQMKRLILKSPFKVSLRNNLGGKITAYLYAEDGKSTPFEYDSCIDNEEKKTIMQTGHYYLYLYDTNSDSFLPQRIAVFDDFDGMNMNVEGANFFSWLSTNKKQPDILLISQFIACNGDQYEAYGLINNQLKKYTFSGRKNSDAFYGKIDRSREYNGGWLAYSIYDDKIHQILLSHSKVSGEIKLKTLKVDRL